MTAYEIAQKGKKSHTGIYRTKLYGESGLRKVSFRHSNTAVKNETNMDIQHDGEKTLLPTTLFFPEAACLKIQADAAWLPQETQVMAHQKKHETVTAESPKIPKNRMKRRPR